MSHPEAGRAIDASSSLAEASGVDDASLIIYPSNGYGNHIMVRHLMMRHQPAAIMHFTDPRYWTWLYRMEAEIREHVPIIYYHVWDNAPPPRYNRDYYRSCDGILSISRLTHNIVREVLGKDNTEVINFEQLNGEVT